MSKRFNWLLSLGLLFSLIVLLEITVKAIEPISAGGEEHGLEIPGKIKLSQETEVILDPDSKGYFCIYYG